MNKKINIFTIAFIILAFIIFILGAFFIVHTFRGLRGQGPFAHPYFSNFHKKRINTENIQGWMTFDFINKSFDLPPGYLKAKLSITDKKYPNISINHWAKEMRQDPASTLENTKKSIQNYQGTNLTQGMNTI